VESSTALGRAFAASGDFERAERQLRDVLAAHPDNALARESLERVHVWQERLADPQRGSPQNEAGRG